MRLQRAHLSGVLIALSAASLLGAARRPSALPVPTPTFSREVVRIFQQHCQSCHHAGGIGPFSLTDYPSAKPHASLIRFMAETRQMPPWKPSACLEFQNENRLSSSGIATIAAWVKGGALEGNRADLPPPRSFVSDGWVLGTPDVVLNLPAPYLGSATEDTHRLFPIPYVFDQDVYVTSMEVRPSARKFVHHVAVYADASGKADALDAQDVEPGYRYDVDLGFDPVAYLGIWAPGEVPFGFPSDTAIRMPAGSKIVFDLHLHPHHGEIEPELTRIGLRFARPPVRKLLQYGSVNNTNFVIPAGATDFPVRASWTADRPLRLHMIAAHMHQLGKTFSVRAVLPDGTEQCLLSIDDFDIRWQGMYTYKEPVALPAGTRFELEGRYDNSVGNPKQQFHPPRDIAYGGNAEQEMCFSYFSFTWEDE